MLVAAFRATLEEVIEADVILHVRDVSHGDTEAQLRDVEDVLQELGIDPSDGSGSSRSGTRSIFSSEAERSGSAISRAPQDAGAGAGVGADRGGHRRRSSAIEARIADTPHHVRDLARRRRWRRRELAAIATRRCWKNAMARRRRISR